MGLGAPDWDRFAHWSRGTALAALAAILVLLLWAAGTAPLPGLTTPTLPSAEATTQAPERDTDLQLYDRIAARMAAGEPYHAVAVEEQRAANFPVRPGFAVRLPTMAVMSALMKDEGVALIALLALLAAGTWYARLTEEPGGTARRMIGAALLVFGMASGLNPKYLVLHEVWAGLLIALAIGLYRPGRWHWAWLAAAGALAIREHALPFVLLFGAFAVWRRDWRESAAWAALVVLFALFMAWHLANVDALLLPSDRPSEGWLALRGLRGLTGNLIETSPLQFLPGWLAAPLALVPLIGWLGWKSPLGTFAALLCAGYGLLFMIAGRDNNFYWALVIAPVWFAGLAFVPMALRSLLIRARGI